MIEISTEETILKYLEGKLLFEFDDEITNQTDLFQAGVLDSFGYLQLIGFLKEQYDIEFSINEMLTNVVVSLVGLVNLVEHKVEAK